MQIRESILQAIRQFGAPVTLEKNGRTYRFIGHIQSRSAGPDQKDPDYSRFGGREDNEFVYYGPADGDGAMLGFGDVLTSAGGRWQAMHVSDFYAGDEVIFRWAVLRRLDGGMEDEPA